MAFLFFSFIFFFCLCCVSVLCLFFPGELRVELGAEEESVALFSSEAAATRRCTFAFPKLEGDEEAMRGG